MKLIKAFVFATFGLFATVSMAGNNGTILDIAKSNENFSTLVTAIEAANLSETLDNEGEFTVFAPTNKAFADLPEGTVEALLKDKEALKNILLYHVVAGLTVPAEKALTLETAEMANGQKISLSILDGKLYLNGNIQVTATDIKASNGIIHVIDGVLLP